MERAADIVFIPTRLEYFGFGEYEFGSNEIIERVERGISGTHRLNGMVLLWGAAVSGGVHLEDAQIFDLAPTILRVMGEPVPNDMDGKVLTEALDLAYADGWPGTGLPEVGSACPSSATVRDAAGATVADDLTDEDRELIADRLRGLGYVG
jgi:hypothetical protein